MNDALRLQISAFVDGELPDNETELLLRRLSQDLALRELVSEYLGIGRMIRRDREVPGIESLRKRIQAALGEQPVEPAVASVPSRNRFLRPIAGLGVASAVAAIALIGLRQVELDGAGVRTAATEDLTTVAAAENPGYTEPQLSEVMDNRPSDLLMQYYLSHGATSRDLGANGILTRFVTLELRGGELVKTGPADPERRRADPPGDAPDRETADIRDDGNER